MAAIVPIEGTDVELLLKRIATELKCCLPAYAVPLFVRVLRNIDKTSEKIHFYCDNLFNLLASNDDVINQESLLKLA